MELIRIAADNNDIDLAKFTKVHGLYLTGGSDASKIDVYESATVTGNAKITLKTAAETSNHFNFGEEGVLFRDLISVDIGGTGAVAYILVS